MISNHDHQPWVSVIVPAWNAQATLAATLASVAAQTWSRFEILIVDDGSTDGTAMIAAAFAAGDSRARVIRIANGGVANARNAGAAASIGAYLAPIDADDVWHPRYLEALVGRMRAAPIPPAFGYAPCRLLDDAGRVIGSGINARVEGMTIQRLLFCNFVGNGSGIVIDRAAFEAVGGYDPCLHAAGCQGYEDYLLQLMLASRGTVAGVSEFLVGYRQTSNAMSRDTMRMSASGRLARRLHRERFPAIRRPLRLRRWLIAIRLLQDALSAHAAGQYVRVAALIIGAMFVDPLAVVTAAYGRAIGLLRRRTATSATSDFRDIHPAEAIDADAHAPRPFVRMQLQRLGMLARTEQSDLSQTGGGAPNQRFALRPSDG